MHNPFADLIDLKVEAQRAGHSVLSLTLAQQHMNPHGVVHGAVVFALAELSARAEFPAGGLCLLHGDGKTHLALERALEG